MALIQPIDTSQFNLVHDPFSFAQTFGPYFSGLDQDDIDLAALEAATAAIDVVSITNFLIGDFEIAAGALDAEIRDPFTVNITSMNNERAGIADDVTAVGTRIPPQGYQPIPFNLQPPPDLNGGFNILAAATPGVPPSIAPPGTIVLPLPAGVTPTVQLINQSHPDLSYFLVGDAYMVIVHAQANVSVVVSAVHNGIPLTPATVGTTIFDGFFTRQGVMGTGDRGQWVQTWIAGGRDAQPTLTFTVE